MARVRVIDLGDVGGQPCRLRIGQSRRSDRRLSVRATWGPEHDYSEHATTFPADRFDLSLLPEWEARARAQCERFASVWNGPTATADRERFRAEYPALAVATARLGRAR